MSSVKLAVMPTMEAEKNLTALRNPQKLLDEPGGLGGPVPDRQSLWLFLGSEVWNAVVEWRRFLLRLFRLLRLRLCRHRHLDAVDHLPLKRTFSPLSTITCPIHSVAAETGSEG